MGTVSAGGPKFGGYANCGAGFRLHLVLSGLVGFLVVLCGFEWSGWVFAGIEGSIGLFERFGGGLFGFRVFLSGLEWRCWVFAGFECAVWVFERFWLGYECFGVVW